MNETAYGKAERNTRNWDTFCAPWWNVLSMLITEINIQMTALFQVVSPHIGSSGTFRSFPCFQQFLLVLMKLRVNQFDQDLPYRFGISQASVSRYFNKWIETIFIRLLPLVTWPGREELQLTMSVQFKKHFKMCVAIIDCFEVLCEWPKSLKGRAQTRSNTQNTRTTSLHAWLTHLCFNLYIYIYTILLI